MGEKRDERIRLAEAQNWRCAYCGGCMDVDTSQPNEATREHVIPRRFGGSDAGSNLIAACAGCNSARGGFCSSKTFFRLRRHLLERGAWPACARPKRRVRVMLGGFYAIAESLRPRLPRCAGTLSFMPAAPLRSVRS